MNNIFSLMFFSFLLSKYPFLLTGEILYLFDHSDEFLKIFDEPMTDMKLHSGTLYLLSSP